MPCPKISAAYFDLDLSEIQIRGSWFYSFFPYTFYFSSLDWSGEAGAVQKGHGTTSPADKAGNPHQPVLRQQAAHRSANGVLDG